MFHFGKLRPFRYGLRTLLLLITLACIILTLLPHEARQYYALKTRAREHVLALGGSVDDFGFKNEPSPGANWLSQRLGYAEAQEVLWQVDLSGRRVTAADLKWIRGCSWIRTLDLSNTKIRDDALIDISECAGLHALWLSDTQVTDAGLRDLGHLKELVVLDVGNARVTYAGLAKLESLVPGTNFQEQLAISRIAIPELTVHVETQGRRLRRADFGANVSTPAAGTLHFTRAVSLTSSQIEDIRRLSSARSLITHQTSLPPGGLEFIKDLRNLEYIILSEGKGQLTDMDMFWLTKLPKLKSLHVSASNLTDEALRHIAAIPRLESLDIGGTQFTNEGIAQLSSALTLENLTLNSTRLTPALLVHLRRLPHLHSLHLYLWRRGSNRKPFEPPPDDVIAEAREAMNTLAEFPALVELGTRGNLMAPQVLSPVTKLVNLQRFQVDGRFVSHEAARRMQVAMPHCHVQRMSGE